MWNICGCQRIEQQKGGSRERVLKNLIFPLDRAGEIAYYHKYFGRSGLERPPKYHETMNDMM